jgi:diguanylate cyclase (GGDEF)-like protein/PAS domain S-box-containing protein
MLPFAIVISRLSDGCTLYVNSKAAQKFDITPDHAVGKSVLDYYVNPADRQGLLSAIDCHGYVQNFEVLLHSTTGDQFWVSLSATLITFGNDPAMFVSLVDVTERKALQMQLEQMAMTDELTGLFNRRYFTGKGAEEFERAKRYNLPLSIMMLDVDHFKGINDSYGHQVGDQVLKEFATLMQHNLRQVDISGRLGGEEFGVLLPNTTGDQALVLAERLRQTIASHTFVIAHHCLSISTSVGVVEMEAYSADLDAMLNQADKALYQAKREGRNRVVAFNRAVFD